MTGDNYDPGFDHTADEDMLPPDHLDPEEINSQEEQ